MRWLAVLLPLVAAGLVAGFVLMLEPRDEPGRPGAPDASETDAAAPDAAQTRPQFTPEASVCQGLLHRPDAGAPRNFPGMYTQRAEAAGLTILAPAGVDPAALEIARQTVEDVFAENDLETALVGEGAYIVIADENQGVLDLPEFACLGQRPDSAIFDHVCGVADHADYPVATVNELDLLGDRSGPCGGLNILYHEIGHLVQNFSIGPQDYYDVRILYQSALSAGKYGRQYAATNPHEYFAEATQNYFLAGEANGGHNREWLRQYDPDMFALVDRLYSGG